MGNVVSCRLIILKSIVFHSVFFSFIVFYFVVFIIVVIVRFAFSVLDSFADHEIYDLFLLFSELIEYVLHGTIFICFFSLVFFSHFFLLSIFFSMDKDLIAHKNNGLVVYKIVRAVVVLKNRIINKCSGISPTVNKAYFSNNPVHNILSVLGKLIRIDTKVFHVVVFYRLFRMLSFFGVVKGAINVRSFISMLNKSVSKDCHRRCMIMTPYKRYCHAVHVFKCSGFNSSSIRAFDIVP